MRNDGFFRVQSELVSTSATPDFPRPPPQPQQQQQQAALPSTSSHLPQTTCASFLINRLLHDREDGNQQAPFSPEFELDSWNEDETEDTDRDDDDDDDDEDMDEEEDNDDITDYTGLCSQRAMEATDIL